MTASKIYIYSLLHGHGYPGLRSGKSGLLEMKERASTLVFQPHYHYTIHSCGAQCTYSLYDKQGGKKIRKREAFYWFPNLLLLKAALSRLDFGPAYYEDPYIGILKHHHERYRAFACGAVRHHPVVPAANSGVSA
ncbi:hypothetical protein RIF29_45497 [Crotalaria pallida]|uniref:Uncharacterized protein n=1 Tax=Crotalaria pallida TaxID=3830 RepID=A0AAN9DWV6_CROPI